MKSGNIRYTPQNKVEKLPIFDAIRNNHLQTLKNLIVRGVDITQVNDEGDSPIRQAIVIANKEIYQELLKESKRIMKEESPELKAKLLEQLNYMGELGLLYMAVIRQDHELLQDLLDLGVDPNMKDARSKRAIDLIPNSEVGASMACKILCKGSELEKDTLRKIIDHSPAILGYRLSRLFKDDPRSIADIFQIITLLDDKTFNAKVELVREEIKLYQEEATKDSATDRPASAAEEEEKKVSSEAEQEAAKQASKEAQDAKMAYLLRAAEHQKNKKTHHLKACFSFSTTGKNSKKLLPSQTEEGGTIKETESPNPIWTDRRKQKVHPDISATTRPLPPRTWTDKTSLPPLNESERGAAVS